MTSKILEWDSNFFGIKIARIEAKTLAVSTLEENISTLQTQDVSLVYLQLQEPLSFQKEYIIPVGGKVLFHKNIETANLQNNRSDSIRSYKPSESIEKLYSLALQSGEYSRFYLDKKLPTDAFQRLYKAWITNSVAREIAEEVLVYEIDGQIAGMVTLGIKSNNWGDIGLIAVDGNYRGKQIGSQLMQAASAYFSSRGITDLGVETQTQNKLACQFYLKNGFKVVHQEYIYHYWLD